MAKLRKSLDALFRKPTTFRDDSFPAPEDVVLRNRFYYWLTGGLVFVALVALLLANVWAGADRSWVGRGELETWIWRYDWWEHLASLAWQQGPLCALAFLFTAGAFPQIGNVVDFPLLSWPLDALFGTPSYYNVKVALIILLNCGACWWFLDRVWGSGLYVWLGAFLFGFNSFFVRELALGRCRSALVFALPLCLLQVYVLQQHPGRRKAAWLGGLWLGLSAVLYAPYGAVLAMLVFIWWLWGQFSRPEQRGEWGRGIAILMLTGLAIYLPWGWSTGGIAVPGYAQGLSALSLFPSAGILEQGSELLPGQAELMLSQPGGSEQVALGEAWTVWQSSLPLNAWWNWNCQLALPLLALALIIVPYAYNWRFPWLWWAAGATFAVLSCGPYLSLDTEGAGLKVCSSWSWPWAWAFGILPSGLCLAPASFLVGLHLVIAVLVVLRLRSWNVHSPTLTHGLALVLLFAQFAQLQVTGFFPLPTTRVENGPLAYLLGDSAPQGLIDVPFGGHYLDLNQEVHGCPVMGAGATYWFPSSWPRTGTDEASRWSNAKLDLNNGFVAHLVKHQVDGNWWAKYSPSDVAALRSSGYSLLILHERGCNILDGNKGEISYFKYFFHLSECLGEPVLNTFEPVYAGMPGCRSVDVSNPCWYRVAVFKL